ncbi:MAG: UDP-N-acetylmuramoyl-tripeptide--D-alanyl-D-alanine ligase [bacterium]
MKKLLQIILKYCAKLILAKYQPDIIGITGSVGKTSAKEAIRQVLSNNFRVRASSKNYNNEFGLPLTIIGSLTAGRSLGGWLLIWLKVAKLLIIKDQNYPQIIILEMGVDRPGDMDYLNSIVQLKIAILTLIGTSHMEFFGSQDNIAKEKAKIFNNLQSGGWAIINADDEFTAKIIPNVKNKVLTFGFDQEADVVASNIICTFQDAQDINSLAGINFKLKYQGSYIPLLLPRVISYSAIYAALVGAAVGFLYEMNGIEIAEQLKLFTPPRGRMNLIAGLNNSMIIDDTYNSSPQSTKAALEILGQINNTIINNKWLVLGDMLELGKDSQEEHQAIGQIIAQIPKAKLLTIGQEAQAIGQGAKEANMEQENIKHFDSQATLIAYLQQHIQAGDLILVKGSQGSRMERVSQALLANPQQAKELLVRQEEEWG